MDAAYPYGPPVFRRILLKLSGESFCRPGEGGISVGDTAPPETESTAE
jgi:uridylate kinase